MRLTAATSRPSSVASPAAIKTSRHFFIFLFGAAGVGVAEGGGVEGVGWWSMFEKRPVTQHTATRWWGRDGERADVGTRQAEVQVMMAGRGGGRGCEVMAGDRGGDRCDNRS